MNYEDSFLDKCIIVASIPLGFLTVWLAMAVL